MKVKKYLVQFLLYCPKKKIYLFASMALTLIVIKYKIHAHHQCYFLYPLLRNIQSPKTFEIKTSPKKLLDPLVKALSEGILLT